LCSTYGKESCRCLCAFSLRPSSTEFRYPCLAVHLCDRAGPRLQSHPCCPSHRKSVHQRGSRFPEGFITPTGAAGLCLRVLRTNQDEAGEVKLVVGCSWRIICLASMFLSQPFFVLTPPRGGLTRPARGGAAIPLKSRLFKLSVWRSFGCGGEDDCRRAVSAS
jgi:hypothetical protein